MRIPGSFTATNLYAFNAVFVVDEYGLWYVRSSEETIVKLCFVTGGN